MFTIKALKIMNHFKKKIFRTFSTKICVLYYSTVNFLLLSQQSFAQSGVSTKAKDVGADVLGGIQVIAGVAGVSVLMYNGYQIMSGEKQFRDAMPALIGGAVIGLAPTLGPYLTGIKI